MAKHDKTLAALFARPIRLNIARADLVSLLEHLGASHSTDSGGSMHDFILDGVPITLHSPHPGKELPGPMVRRVRIFLEEAGIDPP